MGSCVMSRRKDAVNRNFSKKETDANEEVLGCVPYYPDIVAQYDIYNKRLINSPELDFSTNNLYIQRKMMIQN